MASGNWLKRRGAPAASAAYDDGSSSAPSGTAQYPTALDLSSGTNELGISMTVRPSWDVAGVDYRVGYPSGQVFTNVTSDSLPAGATVEVGNKLVRVQGSGIVTLDGWDFTAAGVGYYLYVTSFTGTLNLRNCKFKSGTSHLNGVIFDSTAGTCTFLCEKNEFDGSSDGSDFFGYMVGTPSNSIIQLNSFKNICEDGIKVFSPSGIASAIIRWNAFRSSGYTASGHPDIIQAQNNGLSLDMAGIEVYGNTLIQDLADGSGYPGNLNSLFRAGDLNGRTISNTKVHHNVAIGLGNTGHRSSAVTTYPAFNKLTEFTNQDAGGGTIDGVEVYENYVWTAGGGSYNGGTQQGFFSGPFNANGGAGTSNASYGPNYQMRDGTTLTTTPL